MLDSTLWPSEPVAATEAVLGRAIEHKATDVHIEPQKMGHQIRFRMDGLLHIFGELDHDTGRRVVARLKVMAGLDTTEKRLPKDGQFHYGYSEQARDCRVGTCPTYHGEKLVVRLLDASKGSLALDELGMSEKVLSDLKEVLQKKQGLVLVTGPTGSGKTMTLYAGLNDLDHEHFNIISVEDPVEMALSGINQVSINHKLGLDFAVVLRAMLRQDPDVLMVGEIRDRETAEIALKAAQTGHLVLATMHCNHSLEALTRLRYLGADLDYITSALRLVLAQRLVRKLCPVCRDRTDAHKYGHGSICGHCVQGYKGRTGIFESFRLTHQTSDILLGSASLMSAKSKLAKQVTPVLRQAGQSKIEQGVTDADELQRVL